MRIEAQGKYLEAILEKAEKSLPLNNNNNSTEATRAKLKMALSNVKEEDRKGNVMEIINHNTLLLRKVEDGVDGKCEIQQIQQEAVQDVRNNNNNMEHKVSSNGSSLHFDLNTKGSYDFIASSHGFELQPLMCMQQLSYNER